MTKTHIVIPIGVATPGTPVLSLLDKSITSIQNQTSKEYILTVAADNDVSDKCKKLLIDKNVDTKWYTPGTFFKRGGIWKKISDTWETSDTKYLAFLHYDDLWDIGKLEKQVSVMEEKNLNSSWSSTFIMDENDTVISGDVSIWESFSTSTVGYRTCAFAHSCIVKRNEFFDSGIMEFRDTWSPVFEDMFTLYLQKMGNGQKVHDAKFYWRNHSMNMSNSILSDSKWKNLMEEQRIIGNYSMCEVNSDIQQMNIRMSQLILNLRQQYANR